MTTDTGNQQGQDGNQNDAAAKAAAAAAGQSDQTQNGQSDQGQQQDTQQNGSAVGDAANGTFAELDEDSRKWLEANNVKDVKGLAKQAYEQSKLLGNAIRLPGANATPEEIAAYHEKLGVPKTIEDYGFQPPEKLPEDLPYDGERAKEFATKAKELGIPKGAARSLHDWFIEKAVTDHTGLTAKAEAQMVETAKGETEKLVKQYGPVTGDQFRAQASYADRAIQELGGDNLREALKASKLVGSAQTEDGKTVNYVLNAEIFNAFAKAGRAFFKEGEVLRGDTARLNNPFEEGAGFNITEQMTLWKQDRNAALGFIRAAGKKPEDFGLTA